uniref:Uncharacterized protein n=1 Tax=Leclercia adecarboxylata TaxID=83655 RepID=A0A6H0A487_9ENTR|nr:hypothetical protein [Leclercia adecarboxylata]
MHCINEMTKITTEAVQLPYDREHKKYWGSVSYAAIAGPFPSL